MNKRQKILCNTIIHTASAAAASVGAGLAQIPGSDNTVIVPIQLMMTISLGKVFGMKLSKSSAISLMGASTTTLVGRTASQLLAGWIPIAGNVINATTAATVTEGLGWILAKEFEEDAAKFSGQLAIEYDSSDINQIENAGGEDNDDKTKNNSIKAFKDIRKQSKVLQENRTVG